jgi:3'(2'), 5'-bisphosphate nucleotidase
MSDSAILEDLTPDPVSNPPRSPWAAGARPPASDAAFARWLAQLAGERLLTLRRELGYADPDALRAAGDEASQELIAAELARWRPGDAVLSEEAPDDPARLGADRVWIIDPLDGTREYGELHHTDWAVHIGLWRRAVPSFGAGPSVGAALSRGRMVAGAVALPAHDRVLGTDPPPPYPPLRAGSVSEQRANQKATSEPAGTDRISVAVSRTRPPAGLVELLAALKADPVPMGSAGAKIAAVVSGDVDAYVHAGGQYEWDSAAPVAVALATGLHASRIDGTALEYNQANPWLPDLVVCRKDLASRLVAALRRARG